MAEIEEPVIVINTTNRNLKAKIEYISETEEKPIWCSNSRTFTKSDTIEKRVIRVVIMENEEEEGE